MTIGAAERRIDDEEETLVGYGTLLRQSENAQWRVVDALILDTRKHLGYLRATQRLV